VPQEIQPPRLHATDLRFAYSGGDFSLHLRDLTLQPGQTLRLSGPSGAGKTTLLRLLAGLLPLESGTLWSDAIHPLHALPPAALRAWRLEHAGLIFQDFALLDYLTAAENCLLPSRFLGLSSHEGLQLQERLPALAERLDITPLLHRPTAHLSQGERQRVAILRALITSPGLVFADEPTASLDRKHRDQALALLDDHLRSTGAALVLITHDPEIAARYPVELNLEDLHTA
jgi:putative ABC transport system ATP-binding protein